MKKTYSSKFNRFFTDLLEREGNFAVLDGMPTNLGIEQGTYDAYRKQQNLPPVPVQNITYGDAKDFYYEAFWKPNQYEDLPDNVSYIVADNAVNAGPSTANKILQKSVGADADGIIGPKTKKAVESYYKKTGGGTLESELLNGISDNYMRVVQAKPEKARYIKGWMNRVEKLRSSYIRNQDEITEKHASVKKGYTPKDEQVTGAKTKLNYNESAVTNERGQVTRKKK